jgi:hypothetical protein
VNETRQLWQAREVLPKEDCQSNTGKKEKRDNVQFIEQDKRAAALTRFRHG